MDGQERKDFREYIDAWRGRLAQQQSERRMRARQLQEVAQACARHLVKELGASRVYLFGSLLEEELVHDWSDIDLAVEGLPRSLYFRALRDAGKLLPEGVELDLVFLEEAWPGLAERVRTEGVLLDVAA